MKFFGGDLFNQIVPIFGLFVLLGIAWVISNNRKSISLRLTLWGLGLQFIFALFILKTPIGKPFFSVVDELIRKLLSFSDAGSDFLFKSFEIGIVEAPLLNFAFRVLPTIIFFSALMALFYHLGIMQIIVRFIAKIMQKTLKTSGAETLSVSANIFVGQTEAPLLIRPFIEKMTNSELMAVMVGGFATSAGAMMAIYVKMLPDVPGIAGHLLAASIMSAPAALVIAKIIFPETEKSVTAGNIKIEVDNTANNAMEAISQGATSGMALAANVAAMLIAFVAFIAMLNAFLDFFSHIIENYFGIDFPTSLEEIFGSIFRPLAWTMGAPWDEAAIVGSLMGKKLVLTELIAFGDLRELQNAGEISDRSAIIASYALCGFANFASIGIQIGGIVGIAPSRRIDIVKIVFKAMVGGALASWTTACIAAILI